MKKLIDFFSLVVIQQGYWLPQHFVMYWERKIWEKFFRNVSQSRRPCNPHWMKRQILGGSKSNEWKCMTSAFTIFSFHSQWWFFVCAIVLRLSIPYCSISCLTNVQPFILHNQMKLFPFFGDRKLVIKTFFATLNHQISPIEHISYPKH